MNADFDLLIVGGGSAGSAAACRAVAEGLRVCVAEKMPGMGGTATYGGINRFEHCAGSHGIHEELAQALYSEGLGGGTIGFPNALIVGRYFDETKGAEAVQKPFDECPWSLASIGLRGFGLFGSRKRARNVIWNPFAYLPEAMDSVIQKRLRGATLLFETEYAGCTTEGGRITSVRLRRKSGEELTVRAKVYLDASGDIVFARDAGCGYAVGSEPESTYGESLAPDEYENTVNGATLVFNVESLRERHIDEVPAELQGLGDSWVREVIARNGHGPVACFTRYPGQGDVNINMLPTMEGAEYLSYSPAEAYRQCLGRVWAYWHFLQTERGLDHMRMKHVFPMVGIRESYRLAGEFVLTQTDCQTGIFGQRRADEFIAYGAHSLDTHGARSKKILSPQKTVMEIPYGVPYSCLLPREYENLLVACRGASFSHLAASATRLIVTMMQMGEAAAFATADAIRQNISPKEVSVAKVREKMRSAEYEALIARNRIEE